jgi:hypothetical protein
MLTLTLVGAAWSRAADASAVAPSTRSPAVRPRAVPVTVTDALAVRTPGDSRTIVALRAGGYEAAVYDKAGHIDFYRYVGGAWHEGGRSSYPRIGPEPSETALGEVQGAELSGMANATFIAFGPFTGDSTGDAIAFGYGPRGWGTLAWEPGNILVPTGHGSTDNETPGIYFEEAFVGGQLTTTALSPYFTTAGNFYPLITAWTWDAGQARFVDAHDNAFTSSIVHVPAAATVPEGGPTLTRCPTTPLSGTVVALVAASVPTPPAKVPVERITVHAIGANGVGPVCASVLLPADSAIALPADVRGPAGSQFISAPAWLLVVPVLTGQDNVTYAGGLVGTTPWIIPATLGVSRLIADISSSEDAAACTFVDGRLTRLVVVGTT